MKTFLLYFLLLILLGEVGYLVLNKINKPGEKVLAETTAVPAATLTPSPTSTETPSPTPTATPTPKPTPVPTKKPTPVPQPIVTSTEINGFINRFSSQYSVDPNFVRHVALCESGFNPKAVNGPYVGLFQFEATTWKNIRLEIGEDTNIDLRANAEEAVQTAAYALSKGKNTIWPHCAE